MADIKPKGWIADAAAKVQADQDADLFAAGVRARSKGQCTSLLVATHNGTGERNYHLCGGDRDHKEESHYCGCGASWYGQHLHMGPLFDVVFPG